MEQFEKQIRYYSNYYISVSKEDLIDLLAGNWRNKTGLIGNEVCKAEDRTGSYSERYMAWNQVIALNKKHAIECHTFNHK